LTFGIGCDMMTQIKGTHMNFKVGDKVKFVSPTKGDSIFKEVGANGDFKRDFIAAQGKTLTVLSVDGNVCVNTSHFGGTHDWFVSVDHVESGLLVPAFVPASLDDSLFKME